MWAKVTHIGSLPGTSRCSNYPRKGTHEIPGRWVVFDKEAFSNPTLPAHILSDWTMADEALAECRRVYLANKAKVIS